MNKKNGPVKLAIQALEKWKQQLAFDANVGRIGLNTSSGAPDGMKKRTELYDQLAEAIRYFKEQG